MVNKIDANGYSAIKNLAPSIAHLDIWMMELLNIISEQKATINLQANQIKKLEQKLAVIETKINSQPATQSSPHQPSWSNIVRNKPNSSPQIGQVLVELKQAAKREKNIIIFGVPEPVAVANVTQTPPSVLPCITEILNVIGLTNDDVSFSKRLNTKKASNCRPIVVELKNITNKKLALINSRKLATHENFKTYRVSPDLSPAERELEYQLRKDRNIRNDKLRNDNPDAPFHWGIRDGAIIKIRGALTSRSTPTN